MAVLVLSLCALLLPISTDAQSAGERRVAIFVVNYEDSPPAASWVLDNARDVAAQNDAFWVEQSYGQFWTRSDVFGLYTLPLTFESASYLAVKEQSLAAAKAAGVDLGGYTGFVFVSPISAFVSGGVGNQNGAWIASSFDNPQIPDYQVLAHELGHHLHGVQHAHSYVCADLKPLGSSCTVREYGNLYDVMGSGYGHFNAYVKAGYGWLTPQRVTQSGDYLLAPLETSNGVRALEVVSTSNRTPRRYVLEYRQPIGLDARKTSFLNYDNAWSGVVVTIASGTPMLLHMTPDPEFESPTLQVGQTFCDKQARLSLQPIWANAAGALVRVRYGNCR